MRQALLTLIAAVALATQAQAMTVGSLRGSATLGQPLAFSVPVRLDEGDVLSPDCASAEVLAGEQRVPAANVGVLVEPGADPSERVLRIVTNVPIEEPIVTVTLAVGCPTRMTRRIVAFADPPGLNLPLAAEVQAVPAVVPPAPAAQPAVEPRPRRRPAPAAATANRVAAAPAAAAPDATAASDGPQRQRRAAAAPGATPAAAERPRLTLELEELTAAQTALAAAQARAAAAEAAASAAAAENLALETRLDSIERDVGGLLTTARANRDTNDQLRTRLAEAERDNRLQPVLWALLALFLALALWMGWRLRKLSQERTAWWTAASAVPSALPAEAAEEEPAAPAGTAAAALRVPQPVVVPMSPETEAGAFERSFSDSYRFGPSTMPAPEIRKPPQIVSESEPAPFDALERSTGRREVSVDEQIDLEQQADFFIVLGQDESAIDLLLSHLRGTGGTSPMPYLKLLDIHRRRNEREAYERARTRFNQRFNGVAPEWGADPLAGRTLEDYPQVMVNLHRAWWAPLDAMAELESLLFRRGEQAELFDLPAYQEVLFLYQLARDLHQHESALPAENVDVLLPLDTGLGDLSVRHLDLSSTRVLKPRVDVELPEALDLDLSTHPMPRAEPGREADPLGIDESDAERDARKGTERDTETGVSAERPPVLPRNR